MSRALLLSIKPKWIAKILNGEKTIEIRKTMPKCDLPIDVYIYCTKDKKDYLYYDWNIDIYGITSLEDLENGWSRAINSKSRIRAYQDKNNILTNGHILAKFTLNKVEEIRPKVKLGLLNTYNTYETETLVINPLLEKCCLSYEELDLYLKWKIGYAWHIDNLVIFDKPKELSEFKPFSNGMPQYRFTKNGCEYRTLTKAPQSFMFIESEN